MPLLTVDPARPAASAMARAAAILRDGGLVAFPTETVYGLGANALDAEAVARIFAAKGRPSFNPLIVHVASAEAARDLVAAWPEAATRLASRFWPGPLTLVLPKLPIIPAIVTAGLDTVAVRVPRHPVALALLRAAELPVAAPSANRFTRVSPTSAEHVRAALDDRVDLILDGGPTPVGIESTVLDLTAGEPRLLRPGTIPITSIEEVVGPVLFGAADAGSGEQAARPSPGMVRVHYSPRAELRLFGASDREAMATAARDALVGGRRVGGMLRWPLPVPISQPLPMPHDPASYAARLYSALHELDAAGCDLIVADEVPEGPEWAGVRDRLTRAAQR